MSAVRHVITHIHRHAKDHFIPHEGNGHHPHVLKHHVLVGYSFILILLKAIAIAGSIALPSASSLASAITPQNIIALTNETRKVLNVPELKVDQRLTHAAQAKADDMILNQYFAHYSPTGVSPWYWIKKFGYIYHYSAENLAIHYTQAEDVEGGWMASPGHRANIVNERYTDIGVGVASGDFNGVPTAVVVQMFGTPLAPVVQTTLAAAAPAPNIKPKPPVAVAVKTAPKAVKPNLPKPQPAVNENNVKIQHVATGYKLELQATSATRVTAQVANQTVALAQEPNGTWSGSIPQQTANAQNEGYPLYIQTQNGLNVNTQELAWIAPRADTAQIFDFAKNNAKSLQILDFTLNAKGLQDSVQRTYVFFIVFLVIVLSINVFVKFHIQKFSVITHTLAVIGLCLICIIV